MPAGKTSIPVVLATLLLVSCVAPAATYEVPLTGLIGEYAYGEPMSRTSSYDFGTSFRQIDAALLRIEGSFHPGLYYYQNLNDPCDSGTATSFGHWIERRPNSAVTYSRDYVSGSNPFTLVSHYYPSEYLYDSFTQGTAEVSFEFDSPLFLAIYSVQTLEAPYATVTDASLTVEGTAVDEPIVGDVNLSGFVDDDDLSLLLTNWYIGWVPWWREPDPRNNPLEDDLSLLLAHWGEGWPPGAASVPEPTALAILCAAAFGILRRRRA